MNAIAKTSLLVCLGLSMSLTACLPMSHAGMHMMMGESGEGGSLGLPSWPTVRIDGIDGARVFMQRGVFGNGIDVIAPFQGSFQPTGDATMAAYPLTIDLNYDVVKRYGGTKPVRLRAWLNVPSSMHARGTLRISPTECAMRALLNGDVEKIKVKSEELPMADVACDKASCSAEHPDCGREHEWARKHERQHRGWDWFRRDERATLTIMIAKTTVDPL